VYLLARRLPAALWLIEHWLATLWLRFFLLGGSCGSGGGDGCILPPSCEIGD